jgi:hypothetical protein
MKTLKSICSTSKAPIFKLWREAIAYNLIKDFVIDFLLSEYPAINKISIADQIIIFFSHSINKQISISISIKIKLLQVVLKQHNQEISDMLKAHLVKENIIDSNYLVAITIK